MAKSFLEKLGLVESNEGGNLVEQFEHLTRELSQDNLVPEDINVQANTETVTQPDEIYLQNNLADKSKSIFKIEEIKSVLPETLPNQAKKESVLGMMKVSGLTLNEVLDDSNQRKAVLNGVLQKYTDETINIVESCEAEIKDLEGRINSLKEQITGRKKAQESQEEIITNEVNKVDSIVEFIE